MANVEVSMHLRPVNAIFYHPKHKFIVIYQNGTLWQLPRMKVDIESWRRRESYKGEEEELYLHKHQHIEDTKLAHILPTHNFPSTLTNSSLHLFESWWLTNSYDWINEQNNNQPSEPAMAVKPAVTTKTTASEKAVTQNKKATPEKKTIAQNSVAKNMAKPAQKSTNHTAKAQSANSSTATSKKTTKATTKTTTGASTTTATAKVNTTPKQAPASNAEPNNTAKQTPANHTSDKQNTPEKQDSTTAVDNTENINKDSTANKNEPTASEDIFDSLLDSWDDL